jgi:hypothetical protein
MQPRLVRIAANIDRALEHRAAARDIFDAQIDIQNQVADFLDPAHPDLLDAKLAGHLHFAAVACTQVLRRAELGDEMAGPLSATR